MNFLHGFETVTLRVGPRTIQAVPSSIIILTGIAPIGPVNVPTLVTNPTEAAAFGARLPGFNIPEALDSIFSMGSGIVIVINTFDSTANVAAIASETIVVLNGKFKSAYAPVGATPAAVKNTDLSITYSLGTDYTLDEFGNGTVLNATSIPDGNAKMVYHKLDATTISTSQIIGTVDGTSEARTGLKCIDLILNLFGFKPKLFICPGYSSLPAVSAAMLTYENAYKGVGLIDAPAGTTVAGAIAGRGPSGAFGWNVANSRSFLLFPLFNVADPDPRAAVGATKLEWYSSLMAGVISANDKDNGYWTSPSNKEIGKIISPERVITCSLEDSTAQNQQLNAAGIVTYFNAFGTGTRTFGNRSAMFPSDTQAVNFLNIQRIKDIVEDSISAAMVPYMDQPINQATLDSVRASVNGFISILIQRGALLPGSKCIFDPGVNSVDELAAGHATFTVIIMGPTPLEKITFQTFVDTSLLSQLITV
jgi:hypothetical protein